MDALDVGIVRTLGIQAFTTWPHAPEDLKPSAIARRLGVSVDAVKDRMRRLEAEGVVNGFEIFPNFRQLGQDVLSIRFRVPDAAKRPRVLEELERVDGVCGVTAFLGGDVCVDLCHRGASDLARRVGVLSGLLGGAAAETWYVYRLPPVPRDLTPLDWRILQALRGNARRPLEEAARDIGVSARTVKRRFERMAAEGSFDIVARLDPGALRGYVLFLLLLHLRPGTAPREGRAVLDEFADRWFFSWTEEGAERPSLFVAMLAPSIGDVEALRREAETLPAVERAETLVPVDMRLNMQWIDEAIAERVERAGETAAPRTSRAQPRRRPSGE